MRVGSLGFIGDGTKLAVTGQIGVSASTIDLSATGQASLAILQAFYPNLVSRGDTTLKLSATGDLMNPKLSGTATIVDGRLRPRALPQSLENINGPITFDASGVNIEGLTAEMGGGKVTFGGVISMADYKLGEFDLTATGRDLRLRYPRGFASTVDMRLTLTGPVRSPVLGGTVEVLESIYTGRFSADIGVLGLAAGGSGPGVISLPAEASATLPMALDIDVIAPRALRIQEKNAQLVGTAEMRLFGTLDRPLLTGWVDINGEASLYGNRYFVRNGRIEFTDPTKFEPVFDIEAETRARAAGQIYQVTVRFRGTFAKLNVALTSEPWLPEIDVVSVLFGRPVDLATSELNSRPIQERQAAAIQQAGAILLTSVVSERVGEFLEKTMLIDTLNITPLLGGDAARALNPTARLTLGKRISRYVYLTYSRAVSGPQEEIILLEFEQSDRISWILSRNEDRTFALDFRIRHVF
jgi:translocation and assembly module TamB